METVRFLVFIGILGAAIISAEQQHYRSIWDFLGFGGQAETKPQMGQTQNMLESPCYLPTTTTARPFRGPLCPFSVQPGTLVPTGQLHATQMDLSTGNTNNQIATGNYVSVGSQVVENTQQTQTKETEHVAQETSQSILTSAPLVPNVNSLTNNAISSVGNSNGLQGINFPQKDKLTDQQTSPTVNNVNTVVNPNVALNQNQSPMDDRLFPKGTIFMNNPNGDGYIAMIPEGSTLDTNFPFQPLQDSIALQQTSDLSASQISSALTNQATNINKPSQVVPTRVTLPVSVKPELTVDSSNAPVTNIDTSAHPLVIPHPTFDNQQCSLEAYVPPGFSIPSILEQPTCSGSPTLVNGNSNLLLMEALEALQLCTFHSLLIKSGLGTWLQRNPGYTLFVPTDVAFARTPAWLQSSFYSDDDLLKALITNHVVEQDILLGSLGNEYEILSARAGNHRFRVNIYFPDNHYNIITVDGSRVLLGDIQTKNNVRIHIVDKIIMPNPKRTAASYIQEQQSFQKFWKVVVKAGLESMFETTKPITVFLPNDEAMGKIDIEALFTLEKVKIQNFVLHHVVNGTQYSAGSISGQYLVTGYDKEIKLGVITDGYTKTIMNINGYIPVVKSDIPVDNGALHIVNRCLEESIEFYQMEEMFEFYHEYGYVTRRQMRLTPEEHKKELSSQ